MKNTNARLLDASPLKSPGLRWALTLVLACGAVVAPAWGNTYTFQQGVDPTTGYGVLGADIRNGNAATQEGNDGASAQMVVGEITGAGPSRIVLSFDIGSIPADQSITSVSLQLTQYSTAGSGTAAGVGTLNLSQLTPDGSTSNQMVEGTNTSGTSSTSSVNWNTWNGTTAWTTPGGDFGSALTTAAAQNPLTTTGLTYTFSSTTAFVTAAQNAVTGDYQLQLIITAPTAEANTAASDFLRFYADDADDALGPLLTITTMAVPEPPLIALAVGGMFLLVAQGKARRIIWRA